MNDPLDEEEIEVRDALIRFKYKGDQALSMNLFHRLFYYQRYREARESFDKSRLSLVDVVNRSPYHKAAMRRIYSDLPEQSIARRILVDFIR